jgi:hypothetical protein
MHYSANSSGGIRKMYIRCVYTNKQTFFNIYQKRVAIHALVTYPDVYSLFGDTAYELVCAALELKSEGLRCIISRIAYDIINAHEILRLARAVYGEEETLQMFTVPDNGTYNHHSLRGMIITVAGHFNDNIGDLWARVIASPRLHIPTEHVRRLTDVLYRIYGYNNVSYLLLNDNHRYLGGVTGHISVISLDILYTTHVLRNTAKCILAGVVRFANEGKLSAVDIRYTWNDQ